MVTGRARERYLPYGPACAPRAGYRPRDWRDAR